MNGVHDMGGMDGFGKVEPEPNEPMFHTEWEARVLAMVRAMGAAGAFNIDTSRFYREALPPQVYLSSSYYRKWLLGLEDLLIDAERRLADEGIGGDIFLFKNNTDSAGNSYGCHENFLVGRAGEFSRIADVLLPFLVTRQLICGAGKVLQTPKAATFCLSQRAEHIWEGVSSATTRSRMLAHEVSRTSVRSMPASAA